MHDDVILVLGHSVNKNGELSEEQVLRINKAIELFDKKQAKRLIMTGGFAKRFNQTDRSLAWHMKRFAIKNGVPSDRIITENRSTCTIEDVLFSKRIMDRLGWRSAVLVSSAHHIPRIRMICRYIFSKDYRLRFIPARTPNDRKKVVLKRERERMIENEKRLKRMLKRNLL